MIDKIPMEGYGIDIDVSKKEGSRLNIVLAHGGNNNMNHSLIQKLFDAFGDEYSVLRFNFSFANGPDLSKGSSSIDASNLSKSEAELRRCVEYMGAKNIVLIGKSYGGYISTVLASRGGLGIKQVIAMGYPLHRPDKPEEVRWELTHTHMEDRTLPIEFIIGDSDPVWDVKKAPPILSKYKIDVIPNADHSFKPVLPGGSRDENERKVVERAMQIVDGVR